MYQHLHPHHAPSARDQLASQPDRPPGKAKAPAESPTDSRRRFASEIDTYVSDWTQWIQRRRNRRTWESWVSRHPALSRIDPRPSSTQRIDLYADADAIYALMRIARSEPQAVTALLALLAPVWMHFKGRYLSLETGELASAILSENLDVPSAKTGPVRAIVRKASRQSDHTYWVNRGDLPGHSDLLPVLSTTAAPGDFVTTLVTTSVIADKVTPNSCLHLRMKGRTRAEIADHAGSPKIARNRTYTERIQLAQELELFTWIRKHGAQRNQTQRNQTQRNQTQPRQAQPRQAQPKLTAAA